MPSSRRSRSDWTSNGDGAAPRPRRHRRAVPVLDGHSWEPRPRFVGGVEARLQFVERLGQPLEVRSLARWRHVDVDRGGHRKIVQLGGHASDDDEVDAVLVEDAYGGGGVQLTHWRHERLVVARDRRGRPPDRLGGLPRPAGARARGCRVRRGACAPRSRRRRAGGTGCRPRASACRIRRPKRPPGSYRHASRGLPARGCA